MKNRIERKISELSQKMSNDGLDLEMMVQLGVLQGILNDLKKEVEESEYTLSFTEALDVLRGGWCRIRSTRMKEGFYLMFDPTGLLLIKNESDDYEEDSYIIDNRDFEVFWKVIKMEA